MYNDGNRTVKVAILDLYDGHPNQGMRCFKDILNQYGERNGIDVRWEIFEVRGAHEVPDLSYDIYISSGGPGSPLESEGSTWEGLYFDWLQKVQNWNNDKMQRIKKYVLFVCHSFQLACRHFALGNVCK